jgi:hypothetical protein
MIINLEIKELNFMDLYACIMKLYPKAKVFEDFILVDKGNGAFIETWNLPYPTPSTKQLTSVWNEIELENTKKKKYDELDNSCETSILGRFNVTINGIEYEFSYDMEAQSRFNGTGILFLGNKIEEIPWTAYQNNIRVRIILNKDDFDTVSMAALNHINRNIVKYNDLLVKVNNSTTINQVLAITW